jgi:hypothetical protein
LLILDATNTNIFWTVSSGNTFKRITFDRLYGAIGYPAIGGGGTTPDQAVPPTDNIFAGCGGAACAIAAGDHNYTDTAITNGATNLTYVSGGVFTSTSNYRPKAGTAIIGGGSSSAASVNDNNGNNRGTAPDAGAFQLTPALPLVKGTVTTEQVDGQTLTVNCSTVGTVDSSSISLIANGNGANSVGPLAMTLGTNTASIVIDDIVPGDYQVAISFTNAGGVSFAQGAAPFEIMGMSGTIVDPGTTDPATSVTWLQFPSSGTVGSPSAQFKVGVNGSASGTIVVTPSDAGAGGTFTPSTVQIVDGAFATFTYTPASVGTKTISVTNNGSLSNPSSVTYTSNPSTAPLPAPTISIATATNSIMVGEDASLSGPVNLQGDATGVTQVYLEPLPSGAAQGPFSIVMNGDNWTFAKQMQPGHYRFRAQATANGQTVVAYTGQIVVLGLVNNVNLPV